MNVFILFIINYSAILGKKIFILTDNITVLKLLKKAAKKAGSIKIEICLSYIHKERAWKIFEDQKML